MQVCERSTAINHFPSRLARRAVFDAMKPMLPPESRNRIRKASVCPVTVVASALTEFGRNDATSAVLTALNKLPKKWRLEIEQEANEQAGEVDYVLEEDLAKLDEECDEVSCS